MRARDDAREREIDAQAPAAGEHVNPIAFFRALDRVAGENAVMVADGGDFVATASYIVRPRGPLAWLDPGAFGTLGVGAGFALGAQLVRPQDEVWLIWGDGASGYGLAEFDTFVRHGVPVIAVVGNDASWAQIAREQVKMFNDDVATVLARTDYHAVVQGFGAAGLVVRRPEDVEPVLRQARETRAQRPTGAGQCLARPDRFPRGIDLDVTARARAALPAAAAQIVAGLGSSGERDAPPQLLGRRRIAGLFRQRQLHPQPCEQRPPPALGRCGVDRKLRSTAGLARPPWNSTPVATSRANGSSTAFSAATAASPPRLRAAKARCGSGSRAMSCGCTRLAR